MALAEHRQRLASEQRLIQPQPHRLGDACISGQAIAFLQAKQIAALHLIPRQAQPLALALQPHRRCCRASRPLIAATNTSRMTASAGSPIQRSISAQARSSRLVGSTQPSRQLPVATLLRSGSAARR